MQTPINTQAVRAFTQGRATKLRNDLGPEYVAYHGSTMPPAGVETQARQMQPAPAMINTVASDRVAAMGMNGPAPAMMQPAQAPLMRPAAPASPLGGMDSRPLSARGGAGPMSYSPRGVGTNNPNAYAVGRNNQNFAERTAQMPMPQTPLMQQAPATGMMMGASAPAAPALMAPAPAGMAPAGRDDAFWSQMSADTSGFMASQDKLGADMQAADDQAAAKIEDRAQNTAQEIMGDMRKTARARETYPILDPNTGEVSQSHHLTGNGMMVPRNQAEQPLPPGMVATQAVRDGVQYQMPNAGKPAKPNISWQQGPDGVSKVPYETVTNPKTGQTELRRVKIVDDNGDGIDDRQQPAVAAAGQTKSGNAYSFK